MEIDDKRIKDFFFGCGIGAIISAVWFVLVFIRATMFSDWNPDSNTQSSSFVLFHIIIFVLIVITIIASKFYFSDKSKKFVILGIIFVLIIPLLLQGSCILTTSIR